MSEVITGYGELAGICGHDGTDWLKVKVDGDGHLQIDIDGSALPTGAATSAKQDTMITALQLIDDLRNALDSVGTDELDVNVEESVLPTGAATETTLASCLTALELIDDLRNALAAVAADQLRTDVISSALPTGAATESTLASVVTAVEKIDDLQGALNSVGTDELDVIVESSALPTGAATSANQATEITALQSIQNLVGALHDVGLDELDVNLVGNTVNAGVRQASLVQATYNGVPGDTDWHELLSVSGPGVLIGLDLVSDDPGSGCYVTVDGDLIAGPRATVPQMATSWIMVNLEGSGGESSYAKIGVYDAANDYYSQFLKREIVYNATLVVAYKAGTNTADVGIACQYRGLS